jgi:hypothetical protein
MNISKENKMTYWTYNKRTQLEPFVVADVFSTSGYSLQEEYNDLNDWLIESGYIGNYDADYELEKQVLVDPEGGDLPYYVIHLYVYNSDLGMVCKLKLV